MIFTVGWCMLMLLFRNFMPTCPIFLFPGSVFSLWYRSLTLFLLRRTLRVPSQFTDLWKTVDLSSCIPYVKSQSYHDIWWYLIYLGFFALWMIYIDLRSFMDLPMYPRIPGLSNNQPSQGVWGDAGAGPFLGEMWWEESTKAIGSNLVKVENVFCCFIG